VDPTTGKLVNAYDNHSDAELEAVLATAHGLYEFGWSRGPIQQRLEVLSRLAGQIDERAEELARIVVHDMGKRIAEAHGVADGRGLSIRTSTPEGR
jgi:succinate-semialdehyde dehydrogenase/glutarate-semialdehyde dehydrogenase